MRANTNTTLVSSAYFLLRSASSSSPALVGGGNARRWWWGRHQGGGSRAQRVAWAAAASSFSSSPFPTDHYNASPWELPHRHYSSSASLGNPVATHGKKSCCSASSSSCSPPAASSADGGESLYSSSYKRQQAVPMMDFRKEVERWEAALPVEEAATPPASWYLHPEFLARETHQVFFPGWQKVGRVEQLEKPGSFITGSLLGEPYIVVRDEEGQLRAFFNVCRHHAAQLTHEESGTAAELTCPYHGWTYRLDGRLRIAPKVGGIKNFRAKDYGLRPINVSAWGRWVFINIDGRNTKHLTKELKAIEDVLEETDYQQLQYHCTRVYPVNCNWKVYVDNYLDGGYHVSVLHKDLAAQLQCEQYKTRLLGMASLQQCPGISVDRQNKEEEKGAEADQEAFKRERVGSKGAHYAFIYPNFMINRYGDIMDTNLVIPVSHDKCIVQFDYYFLLDKENKGDNMDVDKWIAENLRTSEQIQEEDEFISASVQRGLHSISYDTGRYAPLLEHADHHFHRLLYQDYTSSST
ncbi:Choline monooxygenase, chloroplastic [Balamuthia mandrillaris]